jgi:hypothetical protein
MRGSKGQPGRVDKALLVVCSPISVISVDGSCRTCTRIGSGLPGPVGTLNSGEASYSSMPIRPSMSTSAVNSPLSLASSRLR